MTSANPYGDSRFECLGGRGVLFLAAAAGVATSTSYVVQPELTRIAADLGASLATTSTAAGLPILGYMFGLALLVPLVDRHPARQLVSVQLAVLSLSLALAALATNVYAFGTALLISGICASTGAQMSTLAGKHSPTETRGRALGGVTAGISAGVLLGRAVGGGLADGIGWRAMLVIVAGACLVCAAGSRVILPGATQHRDQPYLATLVAMPRLLCTSPELSAAAVSGALWFFAFSLIWMGLSLALALPPLNLSPTVIGLYSLAGVAGIVATRAAGQLADRFGSRPVVFAGLALALACTLAMAPALSFAPLMLLALALFDTGLFAAQVANQRRVLNIDPLQPARFNSVYMVVYFIGGSLGTAIAGPIVSLFGWPAAAATAAFALAAAGALYRMREPRRAD
ncbi:MFS transporter [Myxococcus sp. CA033]|uniref:MFS transporter n=1 Tax=Myxococcus sp. CA033 TaxID=2741516 RepID=UPI00157B02A2|nr:MFS transporter [Myxococcus sp. CA033]NTX38794.1 MFS transporter [Myxococcus sp. CA033]